MQNQMGARKRAAPATVPATQQQQGIAYPTGQDTPNLPTDAFAGWDGANAFPTTSGFDNNYFNSDVTMTDNQAQNSGLPTNTDQSTFSGQLVRRNRNNQLALQNRALDAGTWQDLNGTSQGPGWEAVEDDEDLEQKALVARKEAQAKRKTIPPFVQKLSSFLDEKRNTDLIRWSDDGNSFIVLNEDEFAKTLIPELFKHNNYASFVRQLNMYGFHKKVGLSDNSMKSSESKVKNPSEYYNKFFKRSRPELLWLIQKPKTAAGSKRKRDDDKIKGGDSDDENKKYQPDVENYGNEEEVVRGNQEMALIPTREITNMRSELRTVQDQQRLISQAINRIRQQNDQLYNQAQAFQTLHDRHENSINAILTFLATFYNRSLETSNGPNLAEIFSHAMPQANQNRGNVVDVGDYHEDREGQKTTPLRRKMPLALLPAPEAKDDSASPAPRTSSTRTTPARPLSRQGSIFKPVGAPRSPLTKSKSPPIKQDIPTPNLAASAENDEIMSVIQNSNANQEPPKSQSPQLDFSAALNHFQNSDGGSLSPQQRDQLLSYMAATNTGSPSNTTSNDNALINPTPPPMPSLDTFTNNQKQLDLLQKMQQEQDEKVQHLASRLQPLSPTGTIPGYNPPVAGDLSSFYNNSSSTNYANHDPSDLDLNSFIHASDDYFPTTVDGADTSGLPDLNFDFDTSGDAFGAGNGFGSDGADLFAPVDGAEYVPSSNLAVDTEPADGRVESVSSGAPSPAATGEAGGKESPRRKKRKS